MWSLPSLDSIKSSELEGYVNGGGLWSVLLFPRANTQILRGLEKNWHLFSQSIGPQAHIITLLHVTDDESGVRLAFPAHYEESVGRLCHELEIPIDTLPALVALNAYDRGGAPIFWSLKRPTPKGSSDALVELVADLQDVTRRMPGDAEAQTLWLAEASSKLSRYQMGRTFKSLAKRNKKELIALIKKTIKNFM